MTKLYFITEKTSKTGLKFSDLEQKIIQARAEVSKIIEPYGTNKYYPNRHYAVGGIDGFVFEDGTVPDALLFKKISSKHNSWMPRASTKQGKELLIKINQLPKVETQEVNMCIGYDEPFLHHIGYAFNHKTYFGFVVHKEWEVKIPNDCKEVTVTEYEKLFK